ncbi:NAD(P)-binding protein [Plenodomus tracheiphilus IPT5]|uniref:NAD(P)-binding protein n=1 Tax=Plenodomus tracheiphilus IPT5 TaxID=1408161 RepID=A0A6A7B7F2_9PLEO|nr:NAD(P)-binding protein [Plenodomus tracheiphilus IPT5]
MAYPNPTTAILSYAPKNNTLQWRKTPLHIRNPLSDEVLVRILASGLCHTDVALTLTPPDAPGFSPYPRVAGHEGAGIVVKVGSDITHTKLGDKVLLSFDYCGDKKACRGCADETPGYCNEFHEKNIFSVGDVYRTDDNKENVGGEGEAVSGLFFGQSSFSQLAIAKGTSTLNVEGLVKNEEELKLFAPMGCGYQTGAGAVTELADIKSTDAVAIFGLGGVGMSALMTSALRSAHTIIAIDRIPSRLTLARELGATHTIDTSNLPSLTTDLVAAIRAIVPGGANACFDTTGVKPIIDAGCQVLQAKGQMVLIGIVEGGMSVDVGRLMASDDFEKALADTHSGETIKAILTW